MWTELEILFQLRSLRNCHFFYKQIHSGPICGQARFYNVQFTAILLNVVFKNGQHQSIFFTIGTVNRK